MSALDAWVSVPGPVLLLVAAGLLGLLGFVDRRGLWLLLGVTTLTVVAGAVAFPPLPLGILSCLLLGLGMAAARIPRLPSRQVRKNCHLALVVLAFVLAMPIAVAGFTPFMVRNRPAHLAQCQANLHQVADALQKYSLDHQGRYPPTLQALVPRYLELPRCMGPAPAPPAAEAYHARFGLEFGDYAYQATTAPDRFTVSCRGRNHPRRAYGFSEPPAEDCVHPTVTSQGEGTHDE